jgi:hypothetical protein
MMTEKLTIFKAPLKGRGYIAHYSDDGDNEAHGIAINGDLSDAIRESLAVWGLNEEDTYIEASN